MSEQHHLMWKVMKTKISYLLQANKTKEVTHKNGNKQIKIISTSNKGKALTTLRKLETTPNPRAV